MYHARVCKRCHSHVCRSAQLQRPLVVTGSRCGWKQHCRHCNTYFALKITCVGSAYLYTWLFESGTCTSAKTEAAYQISPQSRPFALVFWNLSHIYCTCLLLLALWRLICVVDLAVASPGGTCNPTHPLPVQAHSPLHVSFTPLPPHLSATSLCTGSDFTGKMYVYVKGRVRGRAGASNKIWSLSLWKCRSVFLNKAGGVFIVLHVWDRQSG